jgi:hypothetical protein
MSDSLVINAGSDLNLTFTWPSGVAGQGANLTSYTVDLVDVSAHLVGLLSVALTNAAQGEITITLTWADTIPLGRSSYFRVRLIAPDGTRTTLNLLFIEAN